MQNAVKLEILDLLGINDQEFQRGSLMWSSLSRTLL